MKYKPKTIDEYLAAVSADKRAALEKLRKTIKAAAPKAEECISYQIPAFRLDGRILVSFGAGANHCAFYPSSSTTVAAHQDDLKAYDTSKGAIRFQAGKPLPVALVRKLVKARTAENVGRQEASRSARVSRPRRYRDRRSPVHSAPVRDVRSGRGRGQETRAQLGRTLM